ncbi:MAG: MFS transporter, partial [Desulfobacterales bacterium]
MTQKLKNTDKRDTTDENAPAYAMKWWSMLVVGLGIFMGTLDMSSVNVSLPTLVEELGTDFATIQWVILGYVLVITSMMLGVARLGDIFLKKKLYNWGLVVFILGSTLCGLAPSVGWLIAFRVLQGTGAVVLQALGAAIIVEVFPPSERGRAMGIIGSIVSVGIASGPAIGGMIIGMVGWRWVFLIKLPIGLLTLLASIAYLPAIPPVRK